MFVVVLPIEPLEERYSKDWIDWLLSYAPIAAERHSNFDFIMLLPEEEQYPKIQSGQFLDVVKTNLFKSKQLEMAMKWIENADEKLLKSGELYFWALDGWFPGIEMLAYIRDAMGYNYKIACCFHAGTWDEWDFITQVGMKKWAKDLERSWCNFYDYIFVATEYHKNLLLSKYRIPNETKVHITGFPFYENEHLKFREDRGNRENIVVFPHRLAKEKGISLWDDFVRKAKKMPNLQGFDFVRTKDVCKTKKEYYELLNRAKYSVSFAFQETWGIAMQESVMAGCIPIVPNRLSYVEMYPREFRYPSVPDEPNAALEMACFFESIQKGSPLAELYEGKWKETRNQIVDAGRTALSKMLAVAEGQGIFYTTQYRRRRYDI